MRRGLFVTLGVCIGLSVGLTAGGSEASNQSSMPAGISYVTTARNWTQPITTHLSAGSLTEITLAPCPQGIDTTSTAGYQVFISSGGNGEAANVTGGTCVSGAASGTIAFVPYNSYPSGATVGSASSGIQETLNVACGVDPTSWKNSQCNVTLPANGPGSKHSLNTYAVQGTIYFHSNQSIFSGYGASLDCVGRGACLQVGDLKNTNNFTDNTVSGISFRSPSDRKKDPAFAGVKVTATEKRSRVVTITTESSHGFRVGDMITILFTDNSAYWGDAVVSAVPSPTEFQYAHVGGDIERQSTPGVVALAYVAILDNAENTHLIDISYDKVWEAGAFNNFFDFWDDENATVEHFNNQAVSLNDSANWIGSYVFSAGNQNMQIAPVITMRDSTITANSSNGITVYNSNGLYVENTVLQASGLWEVYSSNSTGNYQGAYLKNIYSESTTALNPLSPPRSPFPGLGIAGLIAGASSGAASFQIAGNGGVQGAFQIGGAGSPSSPQSKSYSYFIVANDTTRGTQTSPMQILTWHSTGSESIPVRWPRVANGTDVFTYDVIRVATPAGFGSAYPNASGCAGGAGGACGTVVQNLSQSTACSGGLVCGYIDHLASSPSTSAYKIKLGTYRGDINFWPGSIVSVNKSVNVDSESQNVVGIGLNGNPIQVATFCGNYGTASPGGYSTCLASMTAPPGNGVANQTATVITDGTSKGGGMALSKGRLNFSNTPGSILSAHHIITLADSQPELTQSTWGYRPPANANDTWIGTDVGKDGAFSNAVPLAFGSPVSITNYIAQTGDGMHANWLERLTAKEKTFAVPVKINGGSTLTVGEGSPLSEMKIYRTADIPSRNVPAQNCVDVVGDAKGLAVSDQVSGITPPEKLGNLSLNAYPGGADSVLLHFCNPTTSPVNSPHGRYSFLAIR